MSLLSFKNISKKETDLKYEQRLAQYQGTLDQYKKIVKENMSYVSAVESKNVNQQKSEDILNQLNKMDNSLEQLYGKLEGLDKSISEDTCKVFFDLQNLGMYQIKEMYVDLSLKIDKSAKKIRSTRIVLWILLLMQLLIVGGILLLLLEKLELVSF